MKRPKPPTHLGEEPHFLSTQNELTRALSIDRSSLDTASYAFPNITTAAASPERLTAFDAVDHFTHALQIKSGLLGGAVLSLLLAFGYAFVVSTVEGIKAARE